MIGENTITYEGTFPEKYYQYCSIDQSVGDSNSTLTIKGESDGTLILKGNATNGGSLIHCYNLKMTDATIIVKDGLEYQYAFNCSRPMDIENCNITIGNCGGSGLYVNALSGTTTTSAIKNSTIKILKSGSAAIRINNNDLTITNSTIEIGETKQGSHGLSADNLTITDNSKVTIKNAGYSGVYAEHKMSIDNSKVTIDKTNGPGGLFAGDKISIDNSEVKMGSEIHQFGVIVKVGTITVNNSIISINKSTNYGIIVRDSDLGSSDNNISVSNSYIDLHCSYQEKCFFFHIKGSDEKPTITNSFVWEKANKTAKTGTIYGEYTLKEDLTINEGEVFVTSKDAKLTTDHALVINGTIQIGENTSFSGSGTASGNGKYIVEKPTEDMITVPQNLMYTGEDLTNAAQNATSLSLTIFSNPQVVTNEKWIQTFDPAVVKNAGKYTLKYTNGSETVSKIFEVKKATEFPTPELQATYDYGIKLLNVTLPFGWKWQDEGTIPVVNNSGYPAIYTTKGNENYDWGNSSIQGYDKETETVTRSINITVNKATLSATDFVFLQPENLIYDGTKKAAKVEVNSGITGTGLISIYYYNNGAKLDDAPADPGTYTVKISVAEGDNYKVTTEELTDPDWTFTIDKKQYNIAIASPIENGTVTADKATATEGETVTLTVNPASGYERESLFYTQSEGTTVPIINNTFVMPESDVTVTATFKKTTVTAPPVDPIDPDPTPVYYTVTLPAIEGAKTDPAAGSFDIQAWDRFSFFLTLEEGYREGSAPVVTVGKKVITPRVSDGKYVITNIHTDINIEISGIVKDVATGNEPLPSGFSVSTTNGLLLITVPYPTRMYLTDTSGRLILTRQLPSGDTCITDLTSGIYILVLEGQKGRKIMLR